MLKSSICMTRGACAMYHGRSSWMEPRTVLRNVHCTPAQLIAEKAFMRCIRRARCIKERQLRNAITDALQRKRWLVREASATIKLYEKNLQTAEKELKKVDTEKEARSLAEARKQEELAKSSGEQHNYNNKSDPAAMADTHQQQSSGKSAEEIFDAYLDALQARRDTLIREYVKKSQPSSTSTEKDETKEAATSAITASSAPGTASASESSHVGGASEQAKEIKHNKKMNLVLDTWTGEGGASEKRVRKVKETPPVDTVDGSTEADAAADANADAEEKSVTSPKTTTKTLARRQSRGKSASLQRSEQADSHTLSPTTVLPDSIDDSATTAAAGVGETKTNITPVTRTSSEEAMTATPLSSKSTPRSPSVKQDGLATFLASHTRQQGGSAAQRSSRHSSETNERSSNSSATNTNTPITAPPKSSRAHRSHSKAEKSETAATPARASYKKRDSAETEQLRHARRTLYEMANREKERRLAAVRGLGIANTSATATSPPPPASASTDQDKVTKVATTPSVVPNAPDAWQPGGSPTGLFRL